MMLLKDVLKDYLDSVSDAIYFCEDKDIKNAIKVLQYLYNDIAALYNNEANYYTEIPDIDQNKQR